MPNWIRLLESWAWRCCCWTRFGADGVGVVGVVDDGDDDCSGLTDDIESAALTTLLVNTVSDEFSTLVDDGLLVDVSSLFVSEFGLLF